MKCNAINYSFEHNIDDILPGQSRNTTPGEMFHRQLQRTYIPNALTPCHWHIKHGNRARLPDVKKPVM
jgi:hypothetical protein